MSGEGCDDLCDDLAVIRFRFRLWPIGEVPPWGPDRQLHWFGLTYGWYWIEIDGLELLRYAPQTLQGWDGDGPAAPDPYADYVDYQVVRLWEDLLDLLPQALEPVPDDLAEFMSSDPDDWVSPDEAQAETAAEWYYSHELDMSHLRCPPRIRWWRRIVNSHDHMTVAWKHQSGEIEFAAPRTGQATMPTSVFVAAAEELDRELLAAMEQRITELERTGPPPGVQIDMQQLRAEQQDRATWLQRRRGQKPKTNWAEVRTGADILVRHPAAGQR
jgi:hypothetical protein